MELYNKHIGKYAERQKEFVLDSGLVLEPVYDPTNSQALEQVARYHRETPEAMKVLQIYTLTQVIHFFYAATWSFTPKALFNWKVDKETKIV